MQWLISLLFCFSTGFTFSICPVFLYRLLHVIEKYSNAGILNKFVCENNAEDNINEYENHYGHHTLRIDALILNISQKKCYVP